MQGTSLHTSQQPEFLNLCWQKCNHEGGLSVEFLVPVLKRPRSFLWWSSKKALPPSFLSLHIERQILLSAVRKQFPLKSKEAAQRNQGLSHTLQTNSSLKLPCPHPVAASAQRGSVLTHKQLLPTFSHSSSSCCSLCSVQGYFTAFQSSSRSLPKLSLTA